MENIAFKIHKFWFNVLLGKFSNREAHLKSENINKNAIFIFLIWNCYCIFPICLRINKNKVSYILTSWLRGNEVKRYVTVKILRINCSQTEDNIIQVVQTWHKFYHQIRLLFSIRLFWSKTIAQMYQLSDYPSWSVPFDRNQRLLYYFPTVKLKME